MEFGRWGQNLVRFPVPARSRILLPVLPVSDGVSCFCAVSSPLDISRSSCQGQSPFMNVAGFPFLKYVRSLFLAECISSSSLCILYTVLNVKPRILAYKVILMLSVTPLCCCPYSRLALAIYYMIQLLAARTRTSQARCVPCLLHAL